MKQLCALFNVGNINYVVEFVLMFYVYDHAIFLKYIYFVSEITNKRVYSYKYIAKTNLSVQLE